MWRYSYCPVFQGATSPVEAEQNGLTLFFSITLTICSRRWDGWFISRQHIHHTNELSAKYTRWPKRIKMKKLNEK
ncbi:hypothetical protein CPZ29_28760 [Klebsiella oxytoca]|nr:hypothetical protein CPZ29_28760 [Klebsiella oxytoca]